jgi:hypothetical protein
VRTVALPLHDAGVPVRARPVSFTTFALLAAACMVTVGLGVSGAVPRHQSDATRLAQDVETLASDAFQGRDNGTPGSLLAQNYLIKQLKTFSVGLDASRSGDDAFKQPFALGVNVVGLIRGKRLPNEYIVVGAHYDHFAPGGCRAKVPGENICNGATDNAAGVAAVLSVGRRIRREGGALQRSVILALWDREEDGLLGSAYYVNHPIAPLDKPVGYVNLDIQGANLLPSLRKISFALGAETGGAEFQSIVKHAIGGGPLQTQRLSWIFGQGRSDYVNFIGKHIPTVFFSDSTGPCYHTTQDEADIVDFGKLRQQAAIAFDVTRRLAQSRHVPTFVADTPVATFEDAAALARVTNAGLPDLDRFPEPQRSQLLKWRSDLVAIVAAGPAQFDDGDVGTMLAGAAAAVSALTLGDCDGFLTKP